jgi:hypothetical protein
MSKEYRNNIATKFINNPNIINIKTDEDKQWLSNFNSLNKEDKIRTLLDIFISQDKIIKEGIDTLEDVHMIHFGTFRHSKNIEDARAMSKSGADYQTIRHAMYDRKVNESKANHIDKDLVSINLFKQTLKNKSNE